MATTTRAVLRQRLSELMFDWHSLSATGNGNGGGTTVVDSKLAQLSADDDFCPGWWVLLTSGTYSGVARQVLRTGGYAAVGTTITVLTTFGGQVLSGVTYELHRTDPTQKHNALNAALRETYSDGLLWKPVTDESLIVDNLLLNPGFETAGAAPPVIANWAAFGAGVTITQEATRVLHGSYSAKVVAGAGAAGGISQNLFSSVNINDVAGKTLKIKGWAWASAASVARLRVTFDGSTYTSTSYHGGSSEWEGPDKIYLEVTVPTTATEMTVLCEAIAGGTAYFDLVWAVIDPVYRYTIPSTLETLYYLTQQYKAGDVRGPYYPFGNQGIPTAGRILRLEGTAILTQPTTDAGTTEIGDRYLDTVLVYAMAWLERGGWLSQAQMQRGRLAEDVAYWEIRKKALKDAPKAGMAKLGASLSRAWFINPSGPFLEFNNSR